jgi:hypothetical protein
MGGRVKEKKKVQILKKMDTCHNSKHSLRQNSAYGENRLKHKLWKRERNLRHI